MNTKHQKEYYILNVPQEELVKEMTIHPDLQQLYVGEPGKHTTSTKTKALPVNMNNILLK